MKSILVVCEGNICRSPMAAGLFAAALPKTRVSSAGLSAMSGMPADQTAVQLMHLRGIDITKHRATQINQDMCLRSELVLVMSAEQLKQVERNYPTAKGRVFRIGEFTKTDVPDPYRRPHRMFEIALKLIDEGVSSWLQRIHTV
jgi:protein-tyrosine phosphatase